MKIIPLGTLLILLTSSLYSQSELLMEHQIEDAFVKSDIISDLECMIESIEEVHPDPYHGSSKEQILSLKDRIIAFLPDTVSKHQAYLIYKRMTAAYKEGHTDVLLFITEKDLPRYQESLPLWIDSYNESGFIVKANAIDSIGIGTGDIITSINGIPESRIKDEICMYSGESDTYALNEAVGFLFPLWIELLDIKSPFIIEYLRNGQSGTVRMQGISAKLYSERYEAYMNQNQQPFHFKILEDHIAYIEFNDFDYPDMFRKFLRRSFKKMQKNDCEGLIIDIRNNGGGKEDLGPMLIDYFSDKPYTRTYAADRKVSPYYKDYQKAIARMDQFKYLNVDTLSAYFNEPNGTIYKERDTTIIHPSNNKLRFKGKVCVLIGPKCFSYANAFAVLIKKHGFATLIGEPLEESQDGYASTCRILLPKTRFVFKTSTAYFLPIDIDNRSPIQPDIFVNQTLEDTKKKKDSILEYAKKWISNESLNE